MKTVFGLRRAAIGLGFVAVFGALQAGPSLAGIQDSVFFVSPDGSSVAFDVRDVSRREVLSRLLRSKEVELEWIDSAFAEERITGAFKGSTDAVLQRLLAQTDFVVVYARDGERSRITRLIIVGKGGAPSKAIELPKLDRKAIVPASGEAPKLVPGGTFTLNPPSPADLALQPLAPVPPGAAASPLVPPPSAGGHPLWIPPLATTR